MSAKHTAEMSIDERRKAAIKRAQQLDLEDRLDEIEPVIRAADDSLWMCCIMAGLFKDRMLRMQSATRKKDAEKAFVESYGWMCSFASGATSGGEGAANSYERDQHLGELERLLGYRPAGFKAWTEA